MTIDLEAMKPLGPMHNNKPTWSPAQKAAIIDAFRHTELTKPEFAAKLGISDQTIRLWINNAKKGGPKRAYKRTGKFAKKKPAAKAPTKPAANGDPDVVTSVRSMIDMWQARIDAARAFLLSIGAE